MPSLYETLKSVHYGDLSPAGSKEKTAVVLLPFCRGKGKERPVLCLCHPLVHWISHQEHLGIARLPWAPLFPWLRSSILKAEKAPINCFFHLHN